MELLYNNKIIVSLCIGSFISLLFYNYNKINNQNEVDNDSNKKNSIYVFAIISLLIYTLLFKTQENITEVLEETYKGEPDF
tara:strand:- start:329 stop:571 length:243 start_codon:yes stop_codon:yes gene_type:complete